MAGLLDLISNSLEMKEQRQEQKKQNALSNLRVSLYALINPASPEEQEDAKKNIDYWAGELVGPGYKDHQEGIKNTLHSVGDAILGAFGMQLPQRAFPQTPGGLQAGARPSSSPPGGYPTPPGGTVPAQGGAMATPQMRQAMPPPTPTQTPDQPGGVNYGWNQTAPSRLAAGGPTSATPTSLSGVPTSKLPGAPRLWPLTQDTLTQGRLSDLEARGVLAGRPGQDAYNYAMAIQRDRTLTPEQKKQAVEQYFLGQSSSAATTQRQTTVELKDGNVIPAWEDTRKQAFETLDHKPIDPANIRAVGVPVEPKLPARLAERRKIEEIIANKDKKYSPEEVDDAKKEKDYMDAQADQAVARSQVLQRQMASGQKIVPGTDEFKVAQDLAYGKLTFQQFSRIFAYSRDAQLREAIYAKASELNPDFNPAEFQAGFQFAGSRQTRNLLAGLDNVQSGFDDLLRLSDAAERSGAPILNRFQIPAGYMMGNQSYSDFMAARTAMADEIAGALGVGSSTDLKVKIGFDLTDPNLSPAQFNHQMRTVVWPFLTRRRDELLDQMGPYAEPERKHAEDIATKQGLTKEGLPRPPQANATPTQDVVNQYFERYKNKQQAKDAMKKDGWKVD